MNVEGLHILVLGAARSGRAAARALLARGARVAVYDRDAEALERLDLDVERVAGPEPPDLEDYDRAVASPGLALAAHAKLSSEVDLAAELCDTPIVGVTGTNGKSTTVALIAEMLRADGRAVAVGGNIGTALCELVDLRADWIVAELSSFQLEHTKSLRARVAVLLNLAPDHLDRHGDLASYSAAKARLAELQGGDAVLVANRDDPWAVEVERRAPARAFPFSERQRLESGVFLDGDRLVLARDGERLLELPAGELSPAARTPIANALASTAAAFAAGAETAALASALAGFRGLPHRNQTVCTRRGVTYVDDSKATNPAAAAASLAAWPGRVWWLAGGRNKSLDFGAIAPAAGRARAAILYGEAAAELARALEGVTEIVRVSSLDEAIAHAADRAEPEDVILLSPACASFDQFRSFEERGERFASLARELPC